VLLDWRRYQRARWLKKSEPVPEWVFPSLEGTALEERNVRHVFTRLLEKAELRQMRVHDLRHTFASLLLQQGESVVYVKEQLGHGSIQITVDTYGRLMPARTARRSIGSTTRRRRNQTQPPRSQGRSATTSPRQDSRMCSGRVVSRLGIGSCPNQVQLCLTR
jgi:hypothetical protein